ncbi:hypothetical protein OG823_02255 [Kitasatospora sp. NBC_00315]
MNEQRTDTDRLDLACVQQASIPFVDTICRRVGIRPDQVIPTFAHSGDVAAATIPLQLVGAVEQGMLRPGGSVALFGLAGGAGAAVMLLRW